MFEQRARSWREQATESEPQPAVPTDWEEPQAAPAFDPDAAPVTVDPLPLLGYIDDAPSAAPAMPTTLNPNAPRKLPGMGGTPMSPDGIHRANVDRKDAETLLTSKEMDTRGDLAVRALDILNGIPDEQRDPVIDKLDDQAFENLLSRVPPDQRERFSQLVASSRRPERKLRMWKETHLSKSRNEVNARKGDVGEDDLQTEYDRKKLYSTLSRDKQIEADEKWEKKHEKELDALTDDDGFPLPDRERTEAQQANLQSHRADVARAAHTKEEIEHEVAMLMGDGKADELTLEQVDKMIPIRTRPSHTGVSTNPRFRGEASGTMRASIPRSTSPRRTRWRSMIRASSTSNT